MIVNKFRCVNCQTVQPESNARLFCNFFLFEIDLWLFLKSCLQTRNYNSKLVFVPSLIAPQFIRQKVWYMIFSGFWGVLCQIVNPESSSRPFCSFSLLDNVLCLFLKTCLRVRKSNFKIIFARSLKSFGVSQQGLVNWSSTLRKILGRTLPNTAPRIKSKTYLKIFSDW